MEELLALAAYQFGAFSRAQANELDVTDAMLRSRVRSGMFLKRGPTAFVVSGATETWKQRVMVACLACRTRCAASMRTAAVLHILDGYSPGKIEVSVRHPERYRRNDIIVHSSRDLPDSDITYVGPIPVTTVERTLIDLGAVSAFHRVEHATDAAEREHLVLPQGLETRHRALRAQGRNGIATMTAILADRGPVVPQSVLERAFVRLVTGAHLPHPVLQHPVDLAYGRVFLDAAYPNRMKGFEVDGHRWHASQSQRAADNRRLRALADAGWDIRRFTYEEVMHQGVAVVHAVRAALNAPFGANS